MGHGFAPGCAVHEFIGRQLAQPDGDGTLQADAEAPWRDDAVLDAMHVITASDGTQIACFVVEPWAYAVDWARDLPDYQTPEDFIKDAKQHAQALGKNWGVDKARGFARSLNDLPSGERVQKFTYRLIMPTKPWQAVDGDSVPNQNFVPPSFRGTVFLLHGWHAPVVGVPYLRPLACALANAGYRVVMPDVRGQGASGGRFRGFGGQDARDMAEVLTALSDQGVVEGPVYAVGHSYGGMLALLWAAKDDRVEAVAALSPVHDARIAFPDSIRGLAKRSNGLASWLLNNFVSDQALRDGLEHAAEIAGMDLAEASVLPDGRKQHSHHADTRRRRHCLLGRMVEADLASSRARHADVPLA